MQHNRDWERNGRQDEKQSDTFIILYIYKVTEVTIQ